MSDAVGDQFLLLNETKQGIGNAILEKGGGYDMVPVEYLESTGTSVGNVINTHLKWDMTTAWEIDADFTGNGICGAYWQWQERQGGRIRSFAGTTGITVRSGTASITVCGETSADKVTCVTATPGGRTLYKFDPVARTASIGAVSATNIQFNDNWNKDGWLCLFGYGRPVSTSYPTMVETRMRIYGARFFKNGVMIRNYVPVVVNGVGYLYDRCQEKLCANDQSTAAPDYIVGSSIYDAEVEYLESTGTQYIDTGISMASNSAVPLKVSVDSYGVCEHGIIHNNVAAGTWLGVAAMTSTTMRIYKDNYNTKITREYSSTRNTRVWDGASGYYENGVLTDSFTAGVGSDDITGIHWHLGRLYDFYTGTPRVNNPPGYRIYSAQMWVNGVLVRDFIPVRKNGVGYLYDKVSGKLFGNAGTGAFLYGEDTGPGRRDVLYDCEVEYLQSTANPANASMGHQYIDLSSLVDQSSGTYLKAEVKWCPLQKDNDRYIFGGGNVNRNWLGIYNNAAPVDFLVPNLGEYCKVFTAGNLIDNDITQGKCIVTTTTSTFSRIYAFCIYYNNGVYNPIKGRLYYIKLYDANDKLVADLVPVRKGLEGYLYDRIGHGMYGNGHADHEAFVLGDDIRKKVMPAKFSEYADAIDTVIQNIKSSGDWNDYNWTDEEATWCVFINLDGGIEHLYTKQEVQADDFDMPPVPQQPLHDDPLLGDALINGIWNWTRKEIQAAAHPMVVGPCYDTKDFKTWLVADIPTDGYVLHMYPPQDNNAYNIDWGDGTTWTHESGVTPGTLTHTYTTAGRYIVKWWRTNSLYAMQLGYGNTPISGPYDNADTFKDQMVYKYIFSMSSNAMGLNTTVNMLNLRYLVYRTTAVGQSQARGRFLNSLKAIAYPRGLTYPAEGGSYDQGNPSPSIVAISLPASANYNTEGCRGTNPVVIRPQVFRAWNGSTTYNLSQSYRDNMWSLKYDHVPGPYKLNNAYLFRNCYQLEKVEWDDYMANVTFTTIGNQTFDTCRCLRELENCNMSEVTTIGTAAFRYCHALWQNQDVSFPKCTKIGSESFRDMRMRSLTFGTTGTTPAITIDNGTNFQECRNLVYVCFHGHVANIRANMLGGCRSLTTVDLRECTSVPKLDNVNCFANTPSLQQIIVPDGLYTSWKAAANWSSTTNNIVNSIVKASEAQPYS